MSIGNIWPIFNKLRVDTQITLVVLAVGYAQYNTKTVVYNFSIRGTVFELYDEMISKKTTLGFNNLKKPVTYCSECVCVRMRTCVCVCVRAVRARTRSHVYTLF